MNTTNYHISPERQENIPEKENILTEKIQTNVDKIIAILSSNSVKTEDIDTLINILHIETSYIKNLKEVGENGIYILIKNLLLVSSKKAQELFFYNIIRKSTKCPFAAVGLMCEFDIFERLGVYDIPEIQDTFRLMEKNNNSK